MRENTYAELMVHVPACTHKDPKNVLIISDNAAAMIDEIAKYNTVDAKAIGEDVDALREMENESFDIVISEAAIDPVSTAHINRVLKTDGLMVAAPFDLENREESTAKFKELGKYFKIVMPYALLATTANTAVLASKEYHPTADVNLQRADLTDGFTVYNSDLHVGIFAMPTYIKKAYLGIIKN